MNSETLFNQIVSHGTLLSSGGIIPSLSAFQQRLQRLTEQFRKCLQQNQHPADQSDMLCSLLRCFLDLQILQHLQRQKLTVNYVPLEPVSPSAEHSGADRLSEILSSLSQCTDVTLFCYSYDIVSLLSLPDIARASSARDFMAGYQSRYFALAERKKESQAQSVTESNGSAEYPADGAVRQISIIAGPCAGNWFSQYDATRTNNSSVLWVAAPDVHTLARRLQYLSAQYPSAVVSCFFPLLGDFFADNALLAAETGRWAHILSSPGLLPEIPCYLMIYSRLSHQRQRHDPDAAIWTRTPESSAMQPVTVKQQLDALYCQLREAASDGDAFAIQRKISGSTLLDWLRDEPLLAALQALFTQTPLQPAGILLADYGSGFTRHGAWSSWLAEHYLLYPALAASTTLPPLPEITLPPLPAEIPSSVPLPAIQPPPLVQPAMPPFPQRTHRPWWPTALLFMTLPVVITVSVYRSLPQMSPQPPVSVTTTVNDDSPWFEHGSTRLLADRYRTLEAMLPGLRSNPESPVLIIGYSDNTGSPTVNRQLSLQRAEVVRDWLIQNSGLPESNFIVDGAGEARPVATNDSAEGRSKNRRVEIIPLVPQSFQVDKDYD